MSYLQPPPNMSPVVVVKDFGGYVDAYAAATEMYRQTNREVRIHECHSACTMALSLPNVCVYRSSIFKFHQAYDPRNHVTNWEVSDQLFNTYPAPVRERLGTLTKQFTILRGQELIDLGVRDCDAPQPRIMLAQASIRPLPDTSSGSGLSMLSGRLETMIPSFGAKPLPVPAGTPPRKPVPPPIPEGMLGAKVPLPPERPDTIETAPNDIIAVPDGIPLPPPRPKLLAVAYTPKLAPIPFFQSIDGSAPILPANRFVPFPKT
jgi:hypothetical protein